MGPADAIGISCGGPLDAQQGLILSPPNLPGWDEIAIVQMLEDATEALRNARFTATSIESVPEQMANKSDMFDLNGRKVQTPQKGIYIMDGKKYLKK
jgi:hypothetical protein